MNDLPGLDVTALEAWLAHEHPELLTGEPLSARPLTGGLSNLSYLVTGGAERWVLRRPPLGHVLSTAHDMRREFRVISALRDTGVPVPVTHLHHVDDDGSAGVGTEFYLMDFVEGATINDRADNGAFSPEQRRALAGELAGVLAALHEVDPESVGLADFGRPAGFLERQVSRWRRQLDQSRSRAIPALDALMDAVSASVPESAGASIVHGDYRLDNTLIALHDDRPRVTAVLDWEMSTLGDSLTDLGLLGVYWELHAVPGAAGSALASAIDPDAGYASFAELVDAYARHRGFRVPDLSWYLAFASAKLAIILEGIHYRYTLGQTVGHGFDTIGRLVPGLADAGLGRLGRAGS